MFETISLYPNPTRPVTFEVLSLAARLLAAQNKRLLAEETYRETLEGLGCLEFVSKEALFSSDLVIAFGGDGTLLSASHESQNSAPPILGVNCGHVGFMTSIASEDLPALSSLDEEHFRIEERMMLSVRKNNTEYHALNEACVVSKNSCRLSTFEVAVDGITIGEYHADGIIVATSTGSTAYSLSAGGAAVDPRLDCICITPVCPHSLLRARAIVVPPASRVKLSCLEKEGEEAVLCMDGREEIELGTDVVEIRRSERVTRILIPRDHHFCNVLYSKFFERN